MSLRAGHREANNAMLPKVAHFETALDEYLISAVEASASGVTPDRAPRADDRP